MSFSKNSSKGFLNNRVQNSYLDSKELSLLNDVEERIDFRRFSDVLPKEKCNFKPFIVDDWDIPDVDLHNDRMILDLSDACVKETNFNPKNHHRTFFSGKKISLGQKNNDLMQNEIIPSVSKDQKSDNTGFETTENELVGALTHLKIGSSILPDATSGNLSEMNTKNGHCIKNLSVPKPVNHVPAKLHFDRSCLKAFHDIKRLSADPKEQTFLAHKKDRFRWSLIPSSGSSLPEEELEEDSSNEINGVLFLKRNFGSTSGSHEKVHNSHGTKEYGEKQSCKEGRYRQTRTKRSRRFPVDRSSLLRSVLTKSALSVV